MATASPPAAVSTAIVSAVIPNSMRLELLRRANEGDRTLSSEIRRALRHYLQAVAEQ